MDIESFSENPDQLAEYPPQEGQEHPTTEQLLLRMAVEKTLTEDQRAIWDMYNYDRLTMVEIAEKLKVSQQNISKRIKVIESRLTKWCKQNQEVYKTLIEAANEK